MKQSISQNERPNRFEIVRYFYRWPIGMVRQLIAGELSLEQAVTKARTIFHTESEDIEVEDPMAPGADSQIEKEPPYPSKERVEM